jgi:hypothetical protein
VHLFSFFLLITACFSFYHSALSFHAESHSLSFRHQVREGAGACEPYMCTTSESSVSFTMHRPLRFGLGDATR